ncbi:hypothetical protein APF79_12630 [bacterium BRH_c32]|nr:MAG: hypothetical protein APF79_12630 [bacterium BRH_c32]
MRRIIFTLLFAFIFVLINTGCSCNCGEKETLKGMVVVVGNEPFTKPALKLDDGTIFIIEGSEEIVSELLNNQGVKYAVTLGTFRDGPDGKILVVEQAEKLDNEKGIK